MPGQPAIRAALPLVVALTGGIGSGKSAVADLFGSRRAAVFDADVIARGLVHPGSLALREIAAQFGPAMITEAGELDRARMRTVVFRDAGERRRLEAILHPRVRDELHTSVTQSHAPYCVLVIPLFAEVRADYAFVDRVLVTDVPSSTQITRLMKRDRCDSAEAERVIATQASRQERLALADDVVDNNGDPAMLGPMIDSLHLLYLRLGSSRNVIRATSAS